MTRKSSKQAVAAERVAEARYTAAVNGVREKIALIGVRSAELSLAQQRLADTAIVAPFDGLVQERHVAPRLVSCRSATRSSRSSAPARCGFAARMPERHAHAAGPRASKSRCDRVGRRAADRHRSRGSAPASMR